MLSDEIVAEARRWCGTPYRHQAACKGVGADCLGLLRGVYLAVYDAVPETPPPYAPQGLKGDAETLLSAAERHLCRVDNHHAPLQAGQVLLFRMRRNLPIRHVGIATGCAHMVHALSGGNVCEVPLTRWWLRHCAARFVFPPKEQNNE